MSKLLEQINTAPKKIKKLGEVFEIIDGDRGVNYPSKSEFTKSGYCVFLNTKNVPLQGFDLSNVDFISKERDELLRKGKLNRNDIVMTTRGTIGNVAIFGEDLPYDCMRINSGMVILRSKPEYDRTYLYTLIKSDSFNAQLKNTSSGSAQPQLPIKDLKEIEFEIPNLPTQKKIAEILSAYDSKIENNNKIIKNLEATARAIFDEWFVNFRFPGHEKVKMVESEMGEIPSGWSVGKIKDLIRVESGFPFSSSVFSDTGKYKLVTIRNVQDGLFVTDCDNLIADLLNKLPKHCLLHSGDILLSLTGNVGRICLVNGENYVLNQRVSILIPVNERDRAYTYFLFRRNDFQNLLISISKGTAQLNLSPVETKELEAIIPNTSTLQKYSEIVTPIYKKIVEINSENVNLKESRDQYENKEN